MGRVRALSTSGDYTIGQSAANFLVDAVGNPAAIAQNIATRLRLLQGEWFVNTSAGVPYSTKVLGKGTRSTYDQAIKASILGTTGVSAIVAYASNLDHSTRILTVTATVSTIYGPLTITTPLSVSQAPA